MDPFSDGRWILPQLAYNHGGGDILLDPANLQLLRNSWFFQGVFVGKAPGKLTNFLPFWDCFRILGGFQVQLIKRLNPSLFVFIGFRRFLYGIDCIITKQVGIFGHESRSKKNGGTFWGSSPFRCFNPTLSHKQP